MCGEIKTICTVCEHNVFNFIASYAIAVLSVVPIINGLIWLWPFREVISNCATTTRTPYHASDLISLNDIAANQMKFPTIIWIKTFR